MNKNDLLKSCDERDVEIRSLLKSYKAADCSLSKATISTQTFQKNRDRKIINLIKQLVEHIDAKEIDLDEASLNAVNQLLFPQQQTKSSVTVNEGDDVMELLIKYKEVKDIYKKLNAACEKQGLRMVQGKVVR